jgi:hypothetical protein
VLAARPELDLTPPREEAAREVVRD